MTWSWEARTVECEVRVTLLAGRLNLKEVKLVSTIFSGFRQIDNSDVDSQHE
jgi:hypothetical protein